ncbi:serine protease [Paenibacillus sp. IB182496]|uniref:Serine protease n=1 Tax=Paenibacillus sabuli TaxID=2772509 RepID=A0A927BVH5_9BACL|nr:S1C family serine protease [Paenibacillus sabuli]MBD2846415.1 serine protease [Paenibacillus sabuli]
MSLFDDDFYSTKVSKRARAPQRDRFRGGARSGGWSPLRLAFVSSLVSALVAVLLFGWLFGGGAQGDRTPQLPLAASADPYERPIQAAAKIRPAVVSIINEQMLSYGMDAFDWEGGESEGEARSEEDGDGEADPAEEGELAEVGMGSGVIFELTGGKARIVTNYHVVENAVKVKAVLATGEVREATVIGKDMISDLAVLEIDGKGIDVAAELGDSTQIQDAETVIAIGNPLGLGESITMGIVSKTRRVIPVSLNQDGVYDWEQEVIQIDASINQGNSGGALVDLSGRLIGINSMKVADYGVEGLGFAIPMHIAEPVMESLIAHGKVLRPYLGVYTLDVEQYIEQQAFMEAYGEESGDDTAAEEEALTLPEDIKRGVIVLETVGPANKAGLKFNDIIVQLDEQKIGSTRELRKYLYAHKAIGDRIDVTFYRGDELEQTSFVLAEMTDEQ